MEAGAKLITTLRQHNPDVFINITVGSWPSFRLQAFGSLLIKIHLLADMIEEISIFNDYRKPGI